MSIKEIEKLREKLAKDPNSKLYVPLAEEYRKEGMLDEAIEVLQKGLEKQPGYMSARVSLGKIYLEKGQLDEARVEFENVVKMIPDNLYAHKKLAEIYRDTGKKDLAIKSFRMFLNLNPLDEDALNNLRELEGNDESLAEEAPVNAAPLEESVPVEEEAPFQAMSMEHTGHEQAQADSEGGGEELDAFKESLFGFKSEAGDESAEKAAAFDEEMAEEAPAAESGEKWSFGKMERGQASVTDEESGIEAVEEDSIEIEEPEETAEELSFADAYSTQASVTDEESGIEATEEDSIEIEESEESGEALSFADIADVLKTDGPGEVREAETPKDEIDRAEVSSEAGRITSTANSEILQIADRFISEGDYLGAINLYQRILVSTPDDRKTFQRIEELRSLLRLLGKDKEVLISKLSTFQGAIIKRGDEFFRRS